MAQRKQGNAKKGKGKGASRKRKTSKRGRKSPDLVDHNLMKALARPLRARILAVLAERVASPSDIATALGEDLSMVSYHVRILFECGVIELDHKEQRRGAIEHFYRSPSKVLVPAEVWDGLPSGMKANVSVRIVQEFVDDVRDALREGLLGDPDGELSWTPLVLDEEGMKELGRLAGEFAESVLNVQARATERMSDDDAGFTATAFLACFRSARSVRDGRRAFASKRL